MRQVKLYYKTLHFDIREEFSKKVIPLYQTITIIKKEIPIPLKSIYCVNIKNNRA